MENSIIIIRKAVTFAATGKISLFKNTDLIIPDLESILSVDIVVLLVNTLNTTKFKIKKIGKSFTLVAINLLNTKFKIESIIRGSKNDHPTPNMECLYLNFKSMMANAIIKWRKCKISFISDIIIAKFIHDEHYKQCNSFAEFQYVLIDIYEV